MMRRERNQPIIKSRLAGCCNQATSSVDQGNISDTMSSLLVKHCDSPAAAAAAHYRSSGGDHAHRAVSCEVKWKVSSSGGLRGQRNQTPKRSGNDYMMRDE